MLRLQPVSLLAAVCFAGFVAPSLSAQAPGRLVGRVEERQYVSPTGQFRVAIPVLPELGGEISDTPTVVTFQDSFTTHVSIAAFPQNAMQRWELNTRGLKEYLAYYFASHVLPAFEGARSDKTAKFIPGTMDGALLAFFELPGGSVFAERVPRLSPNDPAPVAKRGNLVFVRNGHVFVISMELAERVTEGAAYKKTPAEEDELLRTRLLDILDKITFAPAPPPTLAPAKDAAGK